MIRRELFAYTIMLTAGISAGFFVFERMRLVSGAMILITAGVSVCLFSSENWRRPQICCLDIKRISKDREYDAAARVSFEMRVFYVETV